MPLLRESITHVLSTSLKSPRRLFALTATTCLIALALFVRYHHHPDISTIQITAFALALPAAVDSSMYMDMALATFHAPPHLVYSELFFRQHQKFLYPPSSLFLTQALNFAPHLGISSATALKILLTLSWAGTLLLSVRFFRALRAPARTTTLQAASIILLGVLFLPFAEALYRGQVQIFLTLLWAIAVLTWHRGHRTTSAFALALTCAFKPQLALFLLWSALRRQWSFFATFAISLSAIAFASIAVFGLQNNLDYLPVLHFLNQHGEALWANQSLNGLLQRLLHNGYAAHWQPLLYPPYRRSIYLSTIAFQIAGLASALILPQWKRWSGTTADLLFFGCISGITAPIAWEHHYSYFFFALLYLLARAEHLPRPAWLLLSACTLAMSNRIPPLDALALSRFNLLSSYLFYTGLATLILLARFWQLPANSSTLTTACSSSPQPHLAAANSSPRPASPSP